MAKDQFKDALEQQNAKDALQDKQNEMENAKQWKSEQTTAMKMPENGYNSIPLVNLPSAGKFYSPGFSITIKPATAKEVRHFSSIDERDPIDLYDKVNYIIKNNCKFPRGFTYKDVLDIDRFAIVYSIRQITFKNQPNLNTTLKCSS